MSSRSLELADLTTRLVRAASPALALAALACGGTASAGNGGQTSNGTGGSTPSDGSVSTGGAVSPGSGGAVSSGGLSGSGGSIVTPPALPAADGGYPFCEGAGMPGLYGPCCHSVHCIAPPVGEASCPASSAIDYHALGYASLGSGQCQCGGGIEGPYTESTAGKYSDTQGPCCYVIGVMGCTGRPLFVKGKARLAPLVRGRAWA